jgi:hypothetical protein
MSSSLGLVVEPNFKSKPKVEHAGESNGFADVLRNAGLQASAIAVGPTIVP